jgi:hypothetical protein
MAAIEDGRSRPPPATIMAGVCWLTPSAASHQSADDDALPRMTPLLDTRHVTSVSSVAARAIRLAPE